VWVARGQYQRVIANYSEILPILERLTANGTKDSYLDVNLATVHELIADSRLGQGDADTALTFYRKSHFNLEHAIAASPANVDWKLLYLWSHSRLALLGDRTENRIKLILESLQKLRDENRLTPAQQRLLPVAEEARAAIREGGPSWQYDLALVFWRAAPLASNPVREYAFLVAMLRRLQQENELDGEKQEMLRWAEAQLTKLREQ
jgi:hypothetical protein